MANDQIEAIEKEAEKSRVAIAFGDALIRLKNNKDFKDVVLKGYFEAEPIRLVHLKAEASMAAPDKQAAILSQIDAIGNFSAYLNAALHKAAQAERTLEDTEAALIEINEELAGAK